MAKFDKYFLSQLMVMFGFFSLVLVLVYWINRAVVLFDQLIANGQSALVFLEFSALTLPNVVRVVIPIAVFASAIFCTNRLSSDSELVIVQSTGFSPLRLARPVVVFGLIAGTFLAILTHILVPASGSQLALRQAEISQNMTARLLREGTFFHPAKGFTFYIREITPQGELSDIFISDASQSGSRSEYTARRAFLVRSDTGPKLVMIDGMLQDLRLSDQSMSTTSFSEFVFDIGGFIDASGVLRRRPAFLPTSTLLWPSAQVIQETGGTRAALIQEGHERIAQSFLCAILALIGFSTLLVGGFSRFGLWRQIFGAIIVSVLLQALTNYMNAFARTDAALWPLVYASSLAGVATISLIFWISARPWLFQFRRRGVS